MDNRISTAVSDWEVRGVLCSIERAYRYAHGDDILLPRGFWNRVGLASSWTSLQRELQEVHNESRRVLGRDQEG